MDRADVLFADVLMGKTAAGRDPARWRTPLIVHPHRTLTKRDVFNYYSQPSIREAIVRQLRAGPVMVLQNFSGQPTFRRLLDPDTPIRISRDSGDVDDPSDYQYWIERRAVEFHPVLGEKTQHAFIDVDPKPGVPWSDVIAATRAAHDALEDHPDVQSVQLRFSGGDGFHVIGDLGRDVHVDDARRLAQSVASSLATSNPNLTPGEAGPWQIRLDTSTLKQTGSLRGLYSLNQATGLACIPLEEEHLESFRPEQATVRSVLGYMPRNERSLRP